MTTAALMAAFLAACGSSTPNDPHLQQAAPPPASPALAMTIPTGPVPTSLQQLCDSLPWPRPIPRVAGLLVDITPGSLDCWLDTLKMIAADGHDFVSSPEDLQEGRSFRVTSVTPAPGTLAGRGDTITIHGTVIEASEVVALPPATFPCSWIGADEVAQALNAQNVAVDPTGDKAGEGEPFCTYLFDSDSLTSQLFSSASLPVDAGHMFAFNTASKPDESYIDVEGLPGPARCVSTKVGSNAKPSHALWVLLEGNRIYWLNAGLHDVPCLTLKVLAQKAISRIGN